MKSLSFFVVLLWCTTASAQLHKPVKWSYAAKKINKQEAVIYIKATIASGWYIYAMQANNGPTKTRFNFTPSKYYGLIGKTLQPKPAVKYDKYFKKNIAFFEREVTFKQKVKLLKNNAVISGILEFMTCNDKSCLPAEEIAFKIAVN